MALASRCPPSNGRRAMSIASSASRCANRDSAFPWCSPPTSFTATGRCSRCRSGLAATFDAADARTVARIAGLEGYSHGQRWTFAPMVDHPVDPRWGRVVETFGESPLVSSDYAVASIEGFHRSLANLAGQSGARGFRRGELPEALPGLWRIPGRQGLRLRRSLRTQHSRVSPAAVRGRRGGRRAFGDAGIHHRARRRTHVREPPHAAGCPARRARLRRRAGLRLRRHHGDCAITARPPTICRRRCRRCATAP